MATEIAVNDWSKLVAKWLSRKDTMRLSESEMDSAFVAVNVLTSANGKIGYIGVIGNDEGEICFGEAPLPDNVVPAFVVTLTSYGEQTAGTKLLSGVKRSFERKQERVIAGDINADGLYTVDGVWQRNRSADAPDGFLFDGAGGAVFFDGVEKADVALIVNKVISRLNENKPTLDQRREFWNGKTVTAYGKFRQQARSDAQERKDRKATDVHRVRE